MKTNTTSVLSCCCWSAYCAIFACFFFLSSFRCMLLGDSSASTFEVRALRPSKWMCARALVLQFAVASAL
eukprot:2398557-Amphidinium_carterae.1